MTTTPADLAAQALKPCPFCGCAMRIESNRDTHKLYGDHEDACIWGGDEDPVITTPATPYAFAALIGSWNQRAELERKGGEPSDDELNKLAEAHTWWNGSHAMTNYPAFARDAIARWGATPPSSVQPASVQPEKDERAHRPEDWILAMGEALGLNSGYLIPIVPSVVEFQRLFEEVGKRAVLAAHPAVERVPISNERAWELWCIARDSGSASPVLDFASAVQREHGIGTEGGEQCG